MTPSEGKLTSFSGAERTSRGWVSLGGLVELRGFESPQEGTSLKPWVGLTPEKALVKYRETPCSRLSELSGSPEILHWAT